MKRSQDVASPVELSPTFALLCTEVGRGMLEADESLIDMIPIESLMQKRETFYIWYTSLSEWLCKSDTGSALLHRFPKLYEKLAEAQTMTIIQDSYKELKREQVLPISMFMPAQDKIRIAESNHTEARSNYCNIL